MRSIAQHWLLPLVILGLIIGVTYNQLVNSFYEQEEWLGLGNVFIYGKDYLSLAFNNGFFKVLLGENRILSSLITYFFYVTYPFNALPLTIFALILHLLNSLLVFHLIRVLLKNKLAAFLGASFFAVNAVAQSAVSWGAAISTLPATLMVLLSLLYFVKSINYFNKGTIRYKLLTISFVILYVSLLFKQVGIFLIPIFLVTVLFYSVEKQNLKENLIIFLKKYFIPLILFITVILIYLITFKSKPTSDALFLTGSAPYFFETLIVRTVLYPLTAFSQIFIPPGPFLNYARHLTDIYYPFFPPEQFILIAQTAVLDLLSAILSAAILILILILLRRSTAPDQNKILFFTVFTIATFIPYILISKSFSYLDSRYYYPGVIGASFIFAWIFNIFTNFPKVKWLVVILILVLIFINPLLSASAF